MCRWAMSSAPEATIGPCAIQKLRHGLFDRYGFPSTTPRVQMLWFLAAWLPGRPMASCLLMGLEPCLTAPVPHQAVEHRLLNSHNKVLSAGLLQEWRSAWNAAL